MRDCCRDREDVGDASAVIDFVTKALVFPFAVSWLVIALRLRFSGRGLDHPGHRSLHERPTPYGGGLGIVTALLAAGTLLGVPAMFLGAALVLAALSLLDDIMHLPFWLRLAVHLAAAAALCSLLDLPGWLWLPTLLAVGWMTNLFNFMDGADGLAGSQGVTGFSAYAAGFILAGDYTMALWCAAIAAACTGFLWFNWPPARVFMGDVGSIPLGFLAGGLGAWGAWGGEWPLWFPALVFSPFVLDATITLVRRTLHGQRVWDAHREHYYQRMVRMGYGHRGMTLRWGAVMVVGSLLAVGLLVVPASLQWFGATIWLAVLIGLGSLVDSRWYEYKKENE